MKREVVVPELVDESGAAEPVVIGASLQAVIVAAVAALTAFGVEWTQEQVGAVVGLSAVVIAFVVAFFVRKDVTPLSNPKDNAGRPLTP